MRAYNLFVRNGRQGMLSLCAIVKNEENCVEGMIRSVKPIVDEIIIVDTGSTDRTIEIITPLVDKVIQIPFTDFGTVRTFSIQQVTKDWILCLDADERILESDLPGILSLTNQTNYDAWMLPRHQWDNIDNKPNGPAVQAREQKIYPDWRPMLFKRNDNLKWVNRVHEDLTGYKKRGFPNLSTAPHIQHYGIYFKNHDRLTEQEVLYDKLARGITL